MYLCTNLYVHQSINISNTCDENIRTLWNHSTVVIFSQCIKYICQFHNIRYHCTEELGGDVCPVENQMRNTPPASPNYARRTGLRCLSEYEFTICDGFCFHCCAKKYQFTQQMQIVLSGEMYCVLYLSVCQFICAPMYQYQCRRQKYTINAGVLN